MTQSRPNIVFIFADEWRAQATGYAGDPNAHTPNLDQFARESINFTHAVSGCPVCCPYRASLLTGQYPLTHGVFINDVELNPSVYSIARAFKDGGYQTGYIGKWHVFGSPDGKYGRREVYVPRTHQLGFDYWKGFECSHDYNHSPYFFNDDPTRRVWEGYDAFAQSRDAADFIHAQSTSLNPFFLMLSWGPPHFPLHTAPAPYRQIFTDRDLVLRPNVPPGRQDQARNNLRGYYAHIAALDDAFATVREAIRDTGIENNTLVVFTSDHGDMMFSQGLDTKLFPWDESIRVPFLLQWPRLPETLGTSSPIPIDAPDIMPTLLGLCGLSIPPSSEGTDWSPTIRGEQTPTGKESALLIMAAEFTELRRSGFPAYRGLRDARYTYVRSRKEPWLLFDNEQDPFQMTNQINTSAYAAIQEEMEARLQNRLSSLGDEFLDGAVYLERAGLSHYGETRQPCDQPWQNPWPSPR